MTPVYITALGAFFPGPPIENDEIEVHLGRIRGAASRTRRRILQSNGITTRHYAIDAEHRVTHRNSTLATEAIRAAVARSEIGLDDIDLLSCATTLPDFLIPGFASMVHGELRNPSCEIVTAHGVCGSSMMAIKNAWLRVAVGEKQRAIACGSEFASRLFRGSRFEAQRRVEEDGQLPFESDFLRWMLSDGAGAMVIQDQPATRGLSFRIDWIELKSYADRFGVCMWLGGERDPETGGIATSWLDPADEAESAREGAFNLRQDIRMLDDVVKVGIAHLFELMEAGKVDIDDIDAMVCHYSSNFFRGKIFEFLEKAGVSIPEEKWFSNLTTRGNVGAASIFVLLEEFARTRTLRPGMKILCQVPESGRFISSFMQLTVVGQEDAATLPAAHHAVAPAFRESANPRFQSLVRQLATVWFDFETHLDRVPVLDKMNRGKLTLDDYKALIRHLRPQVTEGAPWIARMISNLPMRRFDFRTSFLEHALYGHRDYQMLDRDYVACGGELAEIEAAEPNLGTEALSAFLYARANGPDPIDLLGAMYVIEGLSSRLAPRWVELLRAQLHLRDDQMSFLVHHARHEDRHVTHPIQDLLEGADLTETEVQRIVKTARVAARLYALQLEAVETARPA